MNVYKILSLVLFISFFSCQNDLVLESQNAENDSIQFDNVDEQLWPFFESFENEAALRGLSIDLKEKLTTGEISSIMENNVAGSCQYNSHFNHVTIDKEFWDRASLLRREFVVYHELGHCVLHRDHEESTFDNGICKSIMRSGLEDCRDAYIQQNRTYYIDELFATY